MSPNTFASQKSYDIQALPTLTAKNSTKSLLKKTPGLKGELIIHILTNPPIDLIKNNRKNDRNMNHFSFDLRKDFQQKNQFSNLNSLTSTPKGNFHTTL